MKFLGWLLKAAAMLSLLCGLLNAGEPATAVATVTAGFVTAITVTSGGSGYTSEPAVAIAGGGGSGATAKAILTGDKVSLVVVLAAGSGYLNAPTVVVEAPPQPLGVVLELVPKLTVVGPAGILARAESATNLTGPWTTWTNVTLGTEGTVLVDLSPGSATRFYRVVRVSPAGFVWIKPGSFVMGSPENEPNRVDNEIQHTVTLTKGFWLSDHEVTQAEYLVVMGSNPSWFQGDLNRPVEKVSWNDAVMYCQKLTERERNAGRITAQQKYRLPTEAEWEYSARAGSSAAFYGDLSAIAWVWSNGGGATHPVKQKVPNAWGLYDMIGNVWEWCSDWYGQYPTGNVNDPTGPELGSRRLLRGGCWNSTDWECRTAVRRTGGLDESQRLHGFRPVLSAVP